MNLSNQKEAVMKKKKGVLLGQWSMINKKEGGSGVHPRHSNKTPTKESKKSQAPVAPTISINNITLNPIMERS